jgi:hypothetical protein
MVARSDIIDSIRGQCVVIPDLESLLSDWPQGKSSEEANVQQDVVDRLHMYVITTNTSHAVSPIQFLILNAASWSLLCDSRR